MKKPKPPQLTEPPEGFGEATVKELRNLDRKLREMNPPQASEREIQKVFARGRVRTPGKMNKAEAAYAQDLEIRKRSGEILWYGYEAITLKLAADTRYTPDFAVMLANGEMEMHEVKGHWEDDALVKIKVAAAMFPFRFIAISRDGIREF